MVIKTMVMLIEKNKSLPLRNNIYSYIVGPLNYLNMSPIDYIIFNFQSSLNIVIFYD